ncbi:MAG: rod shape-determining protein MreD [Clostridia bacterium]|nr:rod shape-determining protein MreD [Clostridia bacterium]
MFLNTKAIKRLFRRRLAGTGGDKTRDSYRLETGNVFMSGEENFDTQITSGRIVFAALAVFAAIVLQEAVFNDLRMFGVKPNLVLAVLLLASMCSETDFGLVLGVVSGFSIDIVYGRYLGFYGLMYMLTCFFTAFIVRPRMKGKVLNYLAVAPFLIFIFQSALSFGARFLALYASRAPQIYQNAGRHVLVRIVPSTVYTYLIFALLAVPFTVAWRKLGRRRRGGAILFSQR